MYNSTLYLNVILYIYLNNNNINMIRNKYIIINDLNNKLNTLKLRITFYERYFQN